MHDRDRQRGQEQAHVRPHLYELRLNGRVVGTFAHTREDGLTVCLQLAAKVAEKEKWGGLRALMEVSHDQP